MTVRTFNLPDLGEGLTEGEILGWLVAEGDVVTLNQPVVEVETAKAAVEVPSPFAGRVSTLHHPEGATVEVGAPLISIDTDPDGSAAAAGPAPESEFVPDQASPDAGTRAAAGDHGGRQAVLVGYGPRTGAVARRARKPVAATTPSDSSQVREALPPDPGPGSHPVRHGGLEVGRSAAERLADAPADDPVRRRPADPATADRHAGVAVLAKPPVRKLARDLGVELAEVAPTGPGGTITRDDVQAAAEAPMPRRYGGSARPADEAAAAGEGWFRPARQRETRIPVKGVRRLMADAMVRSAFTAPHVTEFVTVDVTPTMDLVARLKAFPELAGVKVSPLLLVAKALLLAVRRHPEINATWDEDAQEIVVKHYVNLGIAAATPRGLVVPNVKDAEALSLVELARALQELAETAKAGRTQPAEMADGTITITNVGVFGVDTGTPIINPGESAILCFGAVRDRPWVHEGQVVPRKVTQLALSFDHRTVDGALGSMVLADVGRALADPTALIVWA